MKRDRTIALKLSPPLPGFEEFITVYILRGEKTALIDPGPKTCIPELLDKLKELNINPESLEYILITHIHIDHAGGLGELMRYAIRARAMVHPLGVRHMASPDKLWQGSLKALGWVAEQYGNIDPAPESRLVAAVEGMTLNLGDRDLRVIFTPGHAPHHISFWDPESKELFLGEAAGVYHHDVDAVRPATPPPFDLEATLDSLQKLTSLKATSLYYYHGGWVSPELNTIERSRRQLLLWKDLIPLAQSGQREKVFTFLLEQDEELRRLRKLPEPQFEREKFFILNSIAGFLNYLKLC